MRTTKQLLKITLKHGNKIFVQGNKKIITYTEGFKGLCGFIFHLYLTYDVLNEEEAETLIQFIRDNQPDPDAHKLFYWPVGEWLPRQKWLEDQIKSL